MFVEYVSSGDPRCAIHHPGIDKITDPVVLQGLRTYVTPHQERIRGEISVVEQNILDRVQYSAEPLLVDVAITGHTDGQQFPFTTGPADLEQDVLQRVSSGDRTS